MKKTLLLSSALALGIIGISFDSVENVHSVMYATGAPAGVTGSPGDNDDCTSCHGGTASTKANAITTTIPSSGYVPGSTYQITVSIAELGVNKFGFQLSPQNAAGDLLGSMTVTDANTQLVGGNKYLTHKLNGTGGSGSTSWTVDWTAPSAGTGSVTFYAAMNAANGNGQSTGDLIYKSSTTVNEEGTNGISNTAPFGVKVYPNPSSGKFVLSGIIANSNEINVSVYDLNGKNVLEKSISYIELSQAYTLDLNSNPKGIYMLKLTNASGQSEIHKLVMK